MSTLNSSLPIYHRPSNDNDFSLVGSLFENDKLVIERLKKFSNDFEKEIAEIIKVKGNGKLKKVCFISNLPEYNPALYISIEKITFKVLLRLSELLKDFNPQTKISENIEKLAVNIFNNIKNNNLIKSDNYKILSEQIIHYISNVLSPKIREHEKLKEKIIQDLLLKQLQKEYGISKIAQDACIKNMRDITINSQAEDIFRYLMANSVSIIDENKGENLLDAFAIQTPPEDYPSDQIIQYRACEKFAHILEVLMMQLAFVEEKEEKEISFDQDALKIKSEWDNLRSQKKSAEVLIKQFYVDLNNGIYGEKGQTLAILLNGMQQNFLLTPARSVMQNIKQIKENEKPLELKQSSRNKRICYSFADGQVKISYEIRLINKDYSFGEKQLAQSSSGDGAFQTECKFEIKVQNQMTANLDDLKNWNSVVSASVGTPILDNGELEKENEKLIREMTRCLKIGGFNPTSYPCSKAAWV